MCVPVKLYLSKTGGRSDLALSPVGWSTKDGLGKTKDEELLGFVTTCRD